MLKTCLMMSCVFVMFSGPVLAQGRPDTRKMTCEQVQSLIQQRGGVVLTTGQFTYDRYVSDRRWCDHPYVPVSVSVPAKDTRSCPVKNCQSVPWDDFFGRW